MVFPGKSGTDAPRAPTPRKSRLWKAHLPLLGFIAALLAFTLIAIASFYSINRLQERGSWVDHTYQVLSNLEETFSMLKDAESTARAFIISKAPKLLEPFPLYTSGINKNITALYAMAGNNPMQRANIDALKTYIDGHVAYLVEGIEMRKEGKPFADALAHIIKPEGRESMDQVRAQIAFMKDREKELLAERSRAVETSTQDTKLLIVFGTAGAYLMLCGAFWLLRNETRKRQLADHALKQANDTLMRHANQLEASNKELESFSYSISHDLRIPLRAVSGYARMMEEDYADEVGSEGQRLLKVIRDNSKRMGELIDDLLAFSRLGRKDVASNEVDMNALVLDVVDESQRRGEYSSAKVVVDLLPSAWGDRALLRQVWVNLISNALKYSATRDRPMVRISASSNEAEIIYRISDNGVGFDMRYYEKLFGVFQRLHGADEFPGTGVGLAIVQRIITRHGGSVWADSVLEEGATFYFALPQKRSDDA